MPTFRVMQLHLPFLTSLYPSTMGMRMMMMKWSLCIWKVPLRIYNIPFTPWAGLCYCKEGRCENIQKFLPLSFKDFIPPVFKIDQNLEKMGWNNSPVKVKLEFSLTAGSGSHNIYCLLSQCHHKQQGYFSGCKSLLTNGDVLQWSACASICVRIVLFKKIFSLVTTHTENNCPATL